GDRAVRGREPGDPSAALAAVSRAHFPCRLSDGFYILSCHSYRRCIVRHSVLLLLAACLLACSEADPIQPPEEVPVPEPRPAKIEEMRVVKISGDQAARVPPPEVAGLTIRAV